MSKIDFSASFEKLAKYKEQNTVPGGSFGRCLWQIGSDKFILECWMCYKTKGVIIFQIWGESRGFNIWKIVDEL